MNVLFDFLYAVALLLALPVLVVKSWRTGKYRGDWAARFGHVREDGPLGIEELRHLRGEGRGVRRLMIHCVSVGELLSMRQLVDRLLEADERVEIILTTTTDTGTRRAKEIYGQTKYRARLRTYRYPLDFSFAVEAFFDAVKPDAVALVELETWPNFLSICASRRIPVCVINGRLTERSFKRYALVKTVVRGMFERVGWFGVQTDAIAQRFIALGAPRERVTVVPTLKYDTADFTDTIPGADLLAAAVGITPQERVLVGGSTGPGEEEPLVASYLALRRLFPQLRLAIAPRKPETVDQVVKAIRAAGLVPILRSDRPDGTTAPHPLTADEVLVLNTLGELKRLYALACGVFVGRSMVPLGGSDMIEVAALGKPCCFGIFTANFSEVVELLVRENAAVVVKEGEDLTATVRGWLSRPHDALAMGQRARAVIAAQRGSTEKYVERLLGTLAVRR